MAKKKETAKAKAPASVEDDGNIQAKELTYNKEANLFQRLSAIHGAVSFLKKEHKGYNFNYVSSSQALMTIRGLMDQAGVILAPSMEEVRVRDHTTNKGKHAYLTEVFFEMTWINIDNPEETLSCKWYGQGIADGEQGPGIASTYAEKFFILKFFNIATDDQDPDYRSNQKPKDSGKPPAKGKAKASAPAGPPKYVEIMLHDPELKELVTAYRTFREKTKEEVTEELRLIWEGAKGVPETYKENVKASIVVEPPKSEQPAEPATMGGQPAPAPEAQTVEEESTDSLPF